MCTLEPEHFRWTLKLFSVGWVCLPACLQYTIYYIFQQFAFGIWPKMEMVLLFNVEQSSNSNWICIFNENLWLIEITKPYLIFIRWAWFERGPILVYTFMRSTTLYRSTYSIHLLPHYSSTFTKKIDIVFFLRFTMHVHLCCAKDQLRKNQKNHPIKSNERQFISRLCWHCQLDNQHSYRWFWYGADGDGKTAL